MRTDLTIYKSTVLAAAHDSFKAPAERSGAIYDIDILILIARARGGILIERDGGILITRARRHPQERANEPSTSFLIRPATTTSFKSKDTRGRSKSLKGSGLTNL